MQNVVKLIAVILSVVAPQTVLAFIILVFLNFALYLQQQKF